MQKSVSVQVDSDFALLLPSGAYEIKKMEPRSRLRKVILFCLLLSLFGMVVFGYLCPDQVSHYNINNISIIFLQLGPGVVFGVFDSGQSEHKAVMQLKTIKNTSPGLKTISL